MATLVFGHRIGKTARLSPSVVGFIFSPNRSKLLLTKRRDNSRWCLPGGHIEPGESLDEACIREVLEETGLQTETVKLLGVSSSPHVIYTYPDGNCWQAVEIDLELRIIGGVAHESDEVIDYGYFSSAELVKMDLMEPDRERAWLALAGQPPYFR